MYELLYFNDFPKCQNYKILVRDANKNNLIDECKKRLKQTEYCTSKTMLCIIKDKQVVHPVISNLKGGTAHPRQEGWIWLSGEKYTTEEREQNHKKFTEKLKSHMQGIITPPMIVTEKSVVQNSQVKQDTSAENEKKAIKATKITRTKEKKTDTPAISLEESKRILQQNFEKLQKEYRNLYGVDFLESEDSKMFFRKEDLTKILKWNENATDQNDLIDLCAFYELQIGDPIKADVVILGNNPGAKGEFEEIQSFDDIFKEMRDRQQNKNIFYPMKSRETMKVRPWFPNRLIYGVGGTTWTKRNKQDGILYPFMEEKNLNSLCKYANKIATLEMVPYHTKTFAAGENFLNKFDLFDPVPIKKAMENNAVIIALFRNAAERWSQRVPELCKYKYFYVNHKSEKNYLKSKDKSRAEANASLSKQSLRRYSEFEKSINNKGEEYPDYCAYDEIVSYLKKEKRWGQEEV